MKYLPKELKLNLESEGKSDKYLIKPETKQITLTVCTSSIRIKYSLFKRDGELNTNLTEYKKDTLINAGNNTAIKFENTSKLKASFRINIT